MPQITFYTVSLFLNIKKWKIKELQNAMLNSETFVVARRYGVKTVAGALTSHLEL